MSEQSLLLRFSQYPFRHYQGQKHSVWHRLPVRRRASVFILLFMGQVGELRVVLTRRSSKLRTFPGHVSLPGGKADTGLESEWQVARREMHEEIGVDRSNVELRKHHGTEIDHLGIMPAYLSRTMSAVRPCVGFVADPSRLELVLNPGENSDVFSVPLRDFVHPSGDFAAYEATERNSSKVKWGNIPWDLRSYVFPHERAHEPTWLSAVSDLSSEEELDQTEFWGNRGRRTDEETGQKLYDVWGLTANILHDLAQVVYGFELGEIGQEDLMYDLWERGYMRGRLTKEEKKLLGGEISFSRLLDP